MYVPKTSILFSLSAFNSGVPVKPINITLGRIGILRNFADLNCGTLRVCVVFHPPRFPGAIHWLGLPVFILVFPLQSIFTLIEDSDLKKIELCATIHTFFNKL